jgi:uncharacterized SAM-binding protein YcdF (DUF218 family)
VDDLFYYLSKLLWNIASPGGLISIAALTALIARVSSRTKLFNRIVQPLLFFIVLLTFIPVGNIMMHPLETRFPTNPTLPKKLDGIIVFGGALNPVMTQHWNQLETNQYNERLLYFAWLAREHPGASLIFTGGNASMDRSKPTESGSLSSFINLYGIEADRVTFEDQSRTTFENALYSAKLILESKMEGKWLLITSAFHMPRAIGVFCAQGIEVIPYPVDHQTNSGILLPGFQFDFLGNLQILNQAMHEWLGLLAYFLTGKTHKIIPTGCNL